jgi:hypothetical protein
MKDKNCMDLKMAAYCQAVRDLEGKFHGLELHHVLSDYNKAADVLAKTASSRKPVPHGVFASDQLLTVYFGTPNMFITLLFGFDYGTNPPLGTRII